ncbi:TIGR01777 family oxidoreductase [Roseivirga sp. BDSF3-8]|uniref:TIGR01777 family oxidoreductase n=1 Tax=Roseivirga sp. BDSF3-8 TaxID=3241598 RepID=UPI0035323009
MLPPKVIIAGGTGFMGTALSRHLTNCRYRIIVLTRRHQTDKEGIRYVKWDGKSTGVWAEHLEGASAVINLCGRSVDCRYTEQNKQAIYNSRIEPTQTLGQAIKACENPPEVWINGSTATYYRHAMDRPMTEEAGERGEGFSVDVATKWEEAFYMPDLPYTRRVALRTAIVMGMEGGALPVMIRLARAGLGGRQGSGRQIVSWVHIEDFCRSVAFLINCKHAEGGYNVASPAPIPNAILMKKLANKFGPGFGLPAPKTLLEFGAYFIRTETELVLKSRWVLPKRLQEEGFTFHHADMDAALSTMTP